MSRIDLNDPSFPPELIAEIKKVKAEWDELHRLYLQQHQPVAKQQVQKKQEPPPNPGRLAPRDNAAGADKSTSGPLAIEGPMAPVYAFDRDGNYGPRLGITRKMRFDRALSFNDPVDERVAAMIRSDPAVANHVYTS